MSDSNATPVPGQSSARYAGGFAAPGPSNQYLFPAEMYRAPFGYGPWPNHPWIVLFARAFRCNLGRALRYNLFDIELGATL